MKILKKTLSIIAFLALLSFCVVSVTEIFSVPSSYFTKNVAAFNEDAKDTVDTVVVGTSVVGYGFLPTVAFNEYGISAYSFGSSIQQVGAIQGLLDYVKSEQNIKYVVIDVHGFRTNAIKNSTASKARVKQLIHAIPFGKYRFKILNDCFDFSERVYEYYGFSEEEMKIKRDDFSLYFPFVDLHTRWTTGLNAGDLMDYPGKYKGSYSESITFKTYDCSELLDRWSGKGAKLDDFQISLIDELLEYLDKQDYKSLFINYPSFKTKKEESECLGILNYIKGKGYNTLNLSGTASLKKTRLNLKTDFCNNGHLNSKGAIKVTKYLCGYIKDLFEEDYVDHRGEEGYESWDEAIDSYSNFLFNGWKKAADERFVYKRKY